MNSRILTWRREAFQKKNENKESKKRAAALEVSTIFPNSLLPESFSLYFFLLRFSIRPTYQDTSRIKQGMPLRKAKKQKVQTGTVVSVRVEKGRSGYELQMPPALD